MYPNSGLPINLPPEYFAEDNSAPLFETCISFLVLETFFICLLWTARYMSRENKAGIYMTMLMTVGYFTCVGKITLGILMVKIGGAGHHLLALDEERIKHMLKLQTALQILCPFTTSVTKLGILLLLHQILGRISNTTRLVIRVTFVVVLLTLIVQFIVPFANCKPFSKTWNPSPAVPGSCAISALSLWRYLSTPNIVTTVVMICIPIPSLYRLQCSRASKIGLSLVFCVCLMGMVAAIIRFSAFLEVQNFGDITYEIVTPLCWTIAESGIYLVAGVMPTLRPIIRKVAGGTSLDRILSRGSGSSLKNADKALINEEEHGIKASTPV